MLNYLLGGGQMSSYLIGLLLSLPVILLSLSVHEAAHGFAAWRLGDPTARSFGRLTLNPLRHLNPLGFLCMLFAGFGWANPVPVNTRYFKKPRRDMAITALCGPLSNLLLAVMFLLLLRFVGFGILWDLAYPSQFAANVAYFFILFLYYGVQMNVTLAIFNLLPIPPLDGSRILGLALPAHLYYKIMRYERQILIAFIILLALEPRLGLLSRVTALVMRGLFALVGMPPYFLL